MRNYTRRCRRTCSYAIVAPRLARSNPNPSVNPTTTMGSQFCRMAVKGYWKHSRSKITPSRPAKKAVRKNSSSVIMTTSTRLLADGAYLAQNYRRTIIAIDEFITEIGDHDTDTDEGHAEKHYDLSPLDGPAEANLFNHTISNANNSRVRSLR